MNEFLNRVFDEARTHSYWQEKPVSVDTLKTIYEHMKFGPTSANCCPLRMVFVTSKEEKEKLVPLMAPGNADKTRLAPVTVIFAQDMNFYDHFKFLFPHADAKSWFVGSNALIENTAIRNSTLQAAYFMMIARAQGLDCGPMSGFDHEKVDEVFFKGTTFKTNFMCNLGYGDQSKLHPRLPRFSFEEVCQIL